MPINNSYNTLVEKRGKRTVKKLDMVMVREFLLSGMPLEEGMSEFFEESPYETEDSYTSKLERMSEIDNSQNLNLLK
ncbi:hypothetical protein [Fictibacillus phosphorivorans]|uniref:hypothetical protein n=1 Tax=Fictibacillus phosphorivorans TaxID=1221500 RepID=UPI00129364D3|nr:hypothetical protein [Fictibacillus phosphorivorans]MQR93702.1 hypothetical protein [Fictibacillus phosphorivorans]